MFDIIVITLFACNTLLCLLLTPQLKQLFTAVSTCSSRCSRLSPGARPTRSPVFGHARQSSGLGSFRARLRALQGDVRGLYYYYYYFSSLLFWLMKGRAYSVSSRKPLNRAYLNSLGNFLFHISALKRIIKKLAN